MADPKQEGPKRPTKAKGGGPDIATLAGLLVGVGGIAAGLVLDGGTIRDVIQFNAFLIVGGGTLGAVLITTPLPVFLRAAARIGRIFFAPAQQTGAAIDEIIEYAVQARKQGIVSLEQQTASVHDPFLRKALNLAVDGIDLSQIRSIMELEMDLLEQDGEAEAKVFEAAGGYAPTIGIIGAVLGLMQVMKNLANIDEVGRGIAAAFVATVYGVGCANLLLLPAGNKLRAHIRLTLRARELMLEGVLCIVEGQNPKLIRTRLEAYDAARKAPRKTEAGKVAAAAPASAEG